MPRLGLAVNAFCLALAMAKILVVVRLLGLDLRLRTLVYIGAAIGVSSGIARHFSFDALINSHH